MSELQEYTPVFRGTPVQLPLDLFIPPDALEIWLEAFEGPLDLLLYLIRKNNFDILDIPIAEITQQYTDYVEFLEQSRFNLAADYLVMAAWLAEIKSRLLLPKHPTIVGVEEEDHDPRRELIERLQIYAKYKEAAIQFEAQAKMGEQLFPTQPQLPQIEQRIHYPELTINDLTNALKRLLKESALYESHIITPEHLSTQERMVHILSLLSDQLETNFRDLIDFSEGRIGIVTTFMALLELTKQQLVILSQKASYSDITIRLAH